MSTNKSRIENIHDIQTKKQKNSIRKFENVERFFFWKKRQLKKKIIKNEKTRYSYNSANKYKKYLIFRFFEMKRNTRLTSKRLRRIRINEKLFKKKIADKNVVSKKNLSDLKFFENKTNSIKNDFVVEN